MTHRSVFSDAEWRLLVRLPRWVIAAASAVQADGAFGTAAESDVGLVAVAQGRQSSSPLVSAVADELTEAFDAPADAPANAASTLDSARTVVGLLTAKADDADTTAYREWLLAIADMVIKAARSGGVMGLGAQRVTEAEQRFQEELVQALQG